MDGPDVVSQTRAFPKVYYFRVTEHGAPNGVPFEEWERRFADLGGIQGKALAEEVPDRPANVPYFSRYKERHPDDLVLLHFNGNARRPGFDSEAFFAGHWLYFEGCTVTDDVPAEGGETTVGVSDASLFREDVGRFGDRNEDVGLCALDADGEPNWSESEQTRLVSADRDRDEITIERGRHGTDPRRFEAGAAHAAAHVHEGPWGGEGSDLMWHYNHSTACPPDAEGRRCTDVLVDDLADRFLPGGDLERFDGVEFDVLHHEPSYVADALLEGRGIDTDGDGRADGGVVDGVNRYGVGVYEFCHRLRRRLGEDRLVLADAHKTDHQRCVGVLNGVETEVFPSPSAPGIEGWSTAVNRHRFWNANARRPGFSYLKSTYAGDEDAAAFRELRLSLAAAQLLDAGVFLHTEGWETEIDVWDELRKGVEDETGWLGRPGGDPVRLAHRAPDRLDGAGADPASLVDRIEGDGVDVRVEGDAVRLSGDGEGERIAVRLDDLPTDGSDLVVSLSLRAAARPGYPVDVARLARFALPAGRTADGRRREEATWVTPTWFDAGVYLRGLDPDRGGVDLTVEVDGTEPVWLSDLTVHAQPDAMARVFEDGIVLANPSDAEYRFDLTDLAPGREYRRLVGSPGQDPETNDGSRAGETVALGPRDGLFLVETG